MKHWIQAARPRTLILGMCGPSFVALYGTQFPNFNWTSWGLFAFTLLALQIVSNFANDLGDGLKGSDNNREGEERMLSSGKLSVSQFKKAIIGTCVIAFCAGITSLLTSDLDWLGRGILFGIGLLAIAAALTYTLGKKAYGYQGLGDVSVMLFFGFCAVAIPLYLCTGEWDKQFIIPSIVIGLLSVAVLNLNNIRDMDEDKANNKKTLAVKLGPKGARFYHFALLMIPLPLALSFMAKFHSPYNLSIFFVNGIMVVLAFSVLKSFEVKKLDAMMKFHAIGALIFSLTFGVCCGVFA